MMYSDNGYSQIPFLDAEQLPEESAAYSIMVQSTELRDVVQIRSGIAKNLRKEILGLTDLPKWLQKYKKHVVIYYLLSDQVKAD